MNKRLTLEEIGRLAGVSRSTASRVVNGHSEVSTAVKRRVLDVIEQTGYHPNHAARWLVSRRSGIMGLLIPSTVHSLFDDPYFGRLIQGITRAANAVEQTLSLLLFENEQEEMASYNRIIPSGQLDGLIVTATRINPELTKRLMADRVPMVMVGRPVLPKVPFVDVDNVGGSRSAIAHLVKHGRRRIGFIAPPANTTTGQDRLLGYQQGLLEGEKVFDPKLAKEGGFTFDGGYQAMTDLLGARPDAVFCGSDQMATGALKALADTGISCPDDIAVVSFDGLVDAHHTQPSLTTVSQPIMVKAERVVQMLLQILEGDEQSPRQVVLPTVLIRRSSCGCDFSISTSTGVDTNSLMPSHLPVSQGTSPNTEKQTLRSNRR